MGRPSCQQTPCGLRGTATQTTLDDGAYMGRPSNVSADVGPVGIVASSSRSGPQLPILAVAALHQKPQRSWSSWVFALELLRWSCRCPARLAVHLPVHKVQVEAAQESVAADHVAAEALLAVDQVEAEVEALPADMEFDSPGPTS